MQSHGCILISDLAVTSLFMHSLLGMILLYLVALFYTEGVFAWDSIYVQLKVYRLLAPAVSICLIIAFPLGFLNVEWTHKLIYYRLNGKRQTYYHHVIPEVSAYLSKCFKAHSPSLYSFLVKLQIFLIFFDFCNCHFRRWWWIAGADRQTLKYKKFLVFPIPGMKYIQ